MIVLGAALAVLPAGSVHAAVPTGERLLLIVGSNTLGEHAVPSLAKAYLEQVKQGTNTTIRQEGELFFVSATLKNGKEVYVEIHATGSGDCYASFLSDHPCDIGMSSRRISGYELDRIQEKTGDMMARRGTAPGLGCEHPVAMDGLAILVKSDNPLTRISFSELKAVFSLTTTNWKELMDWEADGGPAAGQTIVPVRRKRPSGTLDFFLERIKPDGEAMKDSSSMPAFVSNEEVTAHVARTPGAIGFVGQSYPLAAGVRRLQVYNDLDEATPDEATFPDPAAVQSGEYPLSRLMYFYTSALLLNPEIQPFIKFALCSDGQSVLASQGGLVKIEGTHHEISAMVDLAGRRPSLLAAPSDGKRQKKVILRLHGSNTVGAKCAVYLAFNYLFERRPKGRNQPPIEDMTSSLETPEGEKALAHDVMCDLDGDGTWETVEIRPTGSSDAFRDLQQGWCDIGMSSRRITSAERRDLMKVCGDLGSANAQFALGLDALAIIAHPSNNAREMTLEQVGQIFLGQIRDWSAIGGSSGALHLHTRPERSGTYRSFCDSVLHGRTVIDTARRHAENSLLTEAVMADAAAVGFVPISATGGARVLNIGFEGVQGANPPTDDAVRSGQYPPALCRHVYLYVSAQKPESFTSEARINWPAAYEFARMSQTWRGQAISTACGFVPQLPLRDEAGLVGQREGETPLAYIERLADMEEKIRLGKLRLKPVLRDGEICPQLLCEANQTTLTPESRNVIELKLASWLKTYTVDLKRGLVAEGWSNSIGSDDECMVASTRRAEYVAREVQSALGITVQAVGKGRSIFPPDTTEDGKQINRRVVIKLPPASGPNTAAK